VVQEVKGAGYETPMMQFDALTLVPFDNRLLDQSLLTSSEIEWIDAYHNRVEKALTPLLEGADRKWLQQATAPVGV